MLAARRESKGMTIRLATSGPALALALLAAAACDDVTLEDGDYLGKTESGGSVSFQIRDGQIDGKFTIRAHGSCGTINFGLSNVTHTDGQISSKVTDKTVMRVSGTSVSSTAVEGTYELNGEIHGRGHCEGSGGWGADKVGGGGGGGGNTRCSCYCSCSGCSFKMNKTCSGGSGCSSCSSACSSACQSSKCGSRRSSSGSCS